MPKKTKRVTIRNVAERAGVSMMTVTRALRGGPHISSATRNRVRQAAAALGYRRNPAVSDVLSSIRRRNATAYRGKLAWLNTRATERSPAKWDRPLYDGVCRRAEEAGFLLETIWLDGQGDPGKLTSVLVARGVQGLIIPGPHPSLDHLDLERFACVSTLDTTRLPRLHLAGSDPMHNARECVRQLRRSGYRRMGLLLHELPYSDKSRLEEAGFVLETASLPARDRLPVLLLPISRSSASFIGRFERWVRRYRPDAVICCDENVLDWAHAAGFAVPGELGLAHLNRHAYLTQWAGIDQREDQIGAAATDLVIGQLNRGEFGLPPCRKHVLIEGEWTDGPTACTT